MAQDARYWEDRYALLGNLALALRRTGQPGRAAEVEKERAEVQARSNQRG